MNIELAGVRGPLHSMVQMIDSLSKESKSSFSSQQEIGIQDGPGMQRGMLLCGPPPGTQAIPDPTQNQLEIIDFDVDEVFSRIKN